MVSGRCAKDVEARYRKEGIDEYVHSHIAENSPVTGEIIVKDNYVASNTIAKVIRGIVYQHGRFKSRQVYLSEERTI
jgi:hypothetical protein